MVYYTITFEEKSFSVTSAPKQILAILKKAGSVEAQLLRHAYLTFYNSQRVSLTGKLGFRT